MASGNYLKTFVGAGTYTFPTTQSQIRDNFSDTVPRTVRIPGADGGFDQFGTNRAPAEIGDVAVTFEQYAEDSDGLQAFIDDIREMESWGVGTLTKHCGDEGDRYCLARVNSVTRSESPGENGGMKLTATVNFQVAEPYWLTDGTWNTPVAITANNTNRPVNGVGGVFKTYPKFTLTVTSGTLSFVQIYWGTGGSDVREVILNGFTAGVGDIITIDCRTMEVLHDGSNAFSYVSSFRHANFIWLDPGNNLITINPSGGAITATAAWYERY